MSDFTATAVDSILGVCAPQPLQEVNSNVFPTEHGAAKGFVDHDAIDVMHGGLQEAVQGEEPEVPSIDVVINNVVCTFSVRCHLNLKKIAMEGINVVFKRENGMVSMKIRRPSATASIWSSGKITCTGATSEVDSKKAARRVARCLQKMGYRVRFGNFRIVNVLGTCTFPFGIRITHFSRDYKEQASYEPELHPGVTYRIKSPKATLKIFSTGSVTVTAPCVENVSLAIEHIYPLVCEYQMEKAETVQPSNKLHLMPTHRYSHPAKRPRVQNCDTDSDMDSEDSLMSDSDFGSEDSDC